MLLESLVFMVCVEGKGCGTATEAYYKSNTELQATVKGLEGFGNKLVRGNEYIVYVVTPLYTMASGQGADFKISQRAIININPKKEMIGFVWTY